MLFQLADTTRTPAWKALPRAPRFSTVTTTDNSAAPGKTNVLKTWQYVAPKTETLAYDEDGNRGRGQVNHIAKLRKMRATTDAFRSRA